VTSGSLTVQQRKKGDNNMPKKRDLETRMREAENKLETLKLERDIRDLKLRRKARR